MCCKFDLTYKASDCLRPCTCSHWEFPVVSASRALCSQNECQSSRLCWWSTFHSLTCVVDDRQWALMSWWLVTQSDELQTRNTRRWGTSTLKVVLSGAQWRNTRWSQSCGMLLACEQSGEHVAINGLAQFRHSQTRFVQDSIDALR